MVSALLATSLQCTKLCQLLTYTRNKCPNWELVIYNLVNNHSLWKANHWGKITSNTMKFNKLKLCCFICVNKRVAIWQWTWVAIAKFNMAFVWKCGGKWQGTDNEKYRHETFCNWMDIVQRNCNCLASKFTLHQGQFHSFLVTFHILQNLLRCQLLQPRITAVLLIPFDILHQWNSRRASRWLYGRSYSFLSSSMSWH